MIIFGRIFHTIERIVPINDDIRLIGGVQVVACKNAC